MRNVFQSEQKTPFQPLAKNFEASSVLFTMVPVSILQSWHCNTQSTNSRGSSAFLQNLLQIPLFQELLQTVIRKPRTRKTYLETTFQKLFFIWCLSGLRSTLPRTCVSVMQLRISVTFSEVVGTHHLYRSSCVCPTLVAQTYSKWGTS